MPKYSTPPSKSNHLKIIAGSKQPEIRLSADPDKPEPIRLSGLSPAAEMEPGEYLAQCVESIFKRTKNQVINNFVIVDGEHAGTALSQWINGVTKSLSPETRYAKECAAALGRPISVADDLTPAAVFKGKTFLVCVGWRMSKDPGGGRASDDYALHRKDGRDFLRVLRIIGEASL
jgi:hypothetical protein